MNMDVDALAFDHEAHRMRRSLIVHADCFEWLARLPENSLHAVVTDPPYGVKGYDADWYKLCVVVTGPRTPKKSSLVSRPCRAGAMNRGAFFESGCRRA